MREVKLTILVPTYNHGKFIRQSLESILCQEVDFPYNIVIGDDCSTDNTREIIMEYQHKYPEIIQPLLFEKHGGISGKYSYILQRPDLFRGEYIAHLDGDDYWIFKGKLRRQVQVMDENPQYAAVFHDAVIVDQINFNIPSGFLTQEARFYSQNYFFKPDFYAEDIIMRHIIPTSSLVFRKSFFPEEITRLRQPAYSPEWLFELLLAKRGPFKYINEVYSAYRHHATGITKVAGTRRFINANIQILKYLYKDSRFRQHKLIINRAIAKEYKNLFFCDEANKNKLLRLTALLKYIWHYEFYVNRQALSLLVGNRNP